MSWLNHCKVRFPHLPGFSCLCNGDILLILKLWGSNEGGHAETSNTAPEAESLVNKGGLNLKPEGFRDRMLSRNIHHSSKKGMCGGSEKMSDIG